MHAFSKIVTTSLIALSATLAAQDTAPQPPPWNPSAFTPRNENDPGVMKGTGAVKWRPFSDAFAEASKANKPILLFVTAPWCHAGRVMERTTFAEAGVATLINDYFIPVKLNRDERPDIDIRLQQAVQAISNVRGWPLTVCLTPSGKVFFGGTSYTADDDFQTEKPGLRATLRWVAALWTEAQPKAYERADTVELLFKKTLEGEKNSGPLPPRAILQLATGMQQTLDERSGGSKLEPNRFPAPRALDACLLNYGRTKNADSLRVVTITLDAMLRGAIYDRLGGGFHRYCADRFWRVPKFEKMLALNAEMLPVLLHSWQATGNPTYKEAIEKTVRFWNAPPLWNNPGSERNGAAGWSGSQAADFNSVDEGDYFTWTIKEVESALRDETDCKLACAFYDIGETGDQPQTAPDRNVLFEVMPLSAAAKAAGISEADAQQRLPRIHDLLLKARNTRPTPTVDDNLYVDGNALMAAAQLECGRALNHPEWIETGSKVLKEILTHGVQSGVGVDGSRMVHEYFGHRPPGSALAPNSDGGAGLAQDEAAVLNACAVAYEVTGEAYFLEQAEASFKRLNRNFWDPVGGGHFDRIAGANTEPLTSLPWTEKPYMDTSEPPANGLIAVGCMRLFALTMEPTYRDRANATVEAFAAGLPKLGPYSATLTSVADALQNGVTVVTITGEPKSAPVRELVETATRVYAPWKVVLVKPESNEKHTWRVSVDTNAGKQDAASAAELKAILNGSNTQKP